MGRKEEQDKKMSKEITWDDVEILVVGAGTMGASIVQTYAQSGFNVGFIDVSEEIIGRTFQTIERELEAARKTGIFSDSQAVQTRRWMLATTSYEEACKGKNLKLVIETATENIEIKKKIFRTLDRLCSPHVILATNTSSLDINILARETGRPDKVVWMHYFYLPHKNRAGEYAGSERASKESIEAAAKYMKLAGKVATPILSSRKGGAADVIFVSLLLEAARMIDEGFDIPAIEAAGKEAFNMPVGFLDLMDTTGIPLGIYTMQSFSDSSNPEDPLFKAYQNFFTPPEIYKKLLETYKKAEDKSKVRWISEKDMKKAAEDPMVVDILKHRFLAVAFMTATEVVESGVIEVDEVDRLCQNAFLWKEGPFWLMNRMGIQEALRIMTERMELSHRREINFPIPQLLISQAQKNEPWSLKMEPVAFSFEKEDKVARIMISNPRAANALDNRVFENLRSDFNRANEEERISVIIFDSAPVKTFISGADVSIFLRNIKEGNFQRLKEVATAWQDVIFNHMTGGGKPKIAIVDGAAFGGGVEVALAFALDPDTIVIATERTSYTLPETQLGIYPGLRGILTLPQLIYETTKDAEMAVALSRYYILAGGTTTSSPRLLKYLGLVDFIVQARRRDEVADKLAQAIIDNGGKPLTEEQLASLAIQELSSELTFEEREELRWMKDLFLKSDLIAALYAYARGQAEDFPSEESRAYVQRVAKRVADNSPHAVYTANWLISKGFDDFLKGSSLDERAQWELENHLVLTLQHPDALEGLTALMEKRFPQFNRRYPF
jgi:3-hydroxyacyl-CoA dehydrogenase